MTQSRTAIFIDHNVWDVLFSRAIDLRAEFPADRYGLAITREAEFEIPLTPEPLRSFIETSIVQWAIRVDVKFGFSDSRHTAADQRVGGFGFGSWASSEVGDFYASQQWRLAHKKRKTRLYKNEADIALGARSFEGVVLTFDSKPGPLQDAFRAGGKVIFLDKLPLDIEPLGKLVEGALKGS